MLNYHMRVAPARLYSNFGSFRFLVPISLLCQLINYVTVMLCKSLKINFSVPTKTCQREPDW